MRLATMTCANLSATDSCLDWSRLQQNTVNTAVGTGCSSCKIVCTLWQHFEHLLHNCRQ